MTATALILAAGLGTRLQPLSSVRAKAALPVGGEPLIRRTMRWLVSAGVTDVVVNLHHLPATVTRELGDGRDLGARVRYSWEQPIVLGSAGGPRRALPILGADTFFIVNGDMVTDVSLEAIAAAHRAANALVTMALVKSPDPRRYGGVYLDAGGRVTGFKRATGDPNGWHFIGVQLVHASVFASLPDGQPIGSVGDVYDRLIASNPDAIHGFVSNATYHDIGTVADYVATARAFAVQPGPPRAPRLASSAHVTRTIIWDDVEVGPEAVVDECILTDGVHVPAGLNVRSQILLRAMDGSLAVTPFPTLHG